MKKKTTGSAKKAKIIARHSCLKELNMRRFPSTKREVELALRMPAKFGMKEANRKINDDSYEVVLSGVVVVGTKL